MHPLKDSLISIGVPFSVSSLGNLEKLTSLDVKLQLLRRSKNEKQILKNND
jgi:hypothetical protein